MIKIVGTSSYVHKSNIEELIHRKIPKDKQELFRKFILEVENFGIQYNIIKYDKGNITLIYSPDWDESNEPIVGDCYRWKESNWFINGEFNKNPKISRNYKQIYHNKWQFVGDDYIGFDIETAKKRTKEWNAIPNIKEHKKRIGYKSYWIDLLQKNNIEV